MEEVRKGMSLEELEAQSVELLPDREEMNAWFSNTAAFAVAVNGTAAAANEVSFFVFVVED